MRTADEIFKDAFSGHRDPRSTEYKQGVLAALKFRLEGVRISNPFPEGTAASDAFHSGVDEGHGRWRDATEDFADFARARRVKVA